MNIEELLNRRGDLSTFLVHLTRDYDGRSAIQNLEAILDLGRIRAVTVFGAAKNVDLLQGAASQSVVCLSETPLEHAWTLSEEISGRSTKLEPYGLVFTKAFGRRSGVNPVWYTDITPGHDWLMKSVNKLIDHAGLQSVDDIAHEIFNLTPFIEQMGSPRRRRKEFWWEREWRKVGSLDFYMSDVVAVLAPGNQHPRLQQRVEALDSDRRIPPLLDPRWSTERMLATLSGLTRDAGAIPD